MRDKLDIFLGILLLIGLHLLAVIAIVSVGSPLADLLKYRGDYRQLVVWYQAFRIFFLLQLIYVIPLIIYLQKKRKFALMKGVIIGAIITLVLNVIGLLL